MTIVVWNKVTGVQPRVNAHAVDAGGEEEESRRRFQNVDTRIPLPGTTWDSQMQTRPTARSLCQHAPSFFLYIPELPMKYPDVNNALHKHWITKYKVPMKVADFHDAPISFDEGEIDWFKANVELIISMLSEDQRAERGLRVTPALQGGRLCSTAPTKAMVQGKAAATAAAAQATAAQAKAAAQRRQRRRNGQVRA